MTRVEQLKKLFSDILATATKPEHKTVDIFLPDICRHGTLREANDFFVVVDQIVPAAPSGELVAAKRYHIALDDIRVVETTILTMGGMK